MEITKSNFYQNSEDNHLFGMGHSVDGILQKCRPKLDFCLESSSGQEKKGVEVNGLQSIEVHWGHPNVKFGLHCVKRAVLKESGPSDDPAVWCRDKLTKHISTRKAAKDH